MKDQGTGQEIDPQRAAMDYNRQLSQPTYVTEQQEWNRVHAQLLKSVADAQAKLLAAQNETCDRLEVLNNRLEGLGVLGPRMILQHTDLQAGITSLSGKLDAIGAILAELLTVRRPVARPAKRRRKR